ncbi:hypothetical protein NKR23_g10397 [Pleurostoma richardsiae]|uniref:Uncharacterized protein n=1 Tax=Pleurostoma richardsiae TaxID=41990 RepID=A0AA38RMF0_9PEZI|nr:hypothetical protein NKR23_g10397 [Pleurostoma richardsiae]
MCHVRFDARRCTTCRQAYCVWTNRVRRLRVRLGLRRSLRRRARAWGACGSSWRTRWRESAGTCLACIAATVAPPAAYWRAEVEQADRKGGDEEMEAAPPAPSGNGGVRGRGADDVAADPVDEDVEIGRVMARWVSCA